MDIRCRNSRGDLLDTPGAERRPHSRGSAHLRPGVEARGGGAFGVSATNTAYRAVDLSAFYLAEAFS